MTLPLCLIHANCQGDALQQILTSTPAFARRFAIKKYTNYTREPIPDAEFTQCRLFLYQHLSDKWDDHASAALLQKLPSEAQTLKLPNMFFKGYWPLWTNKTRMAYGDSLLEHLVGLGLSQQEILHIFLRGDLTRKYDLAAIADESLAYERTKEIGAVVGTADLVEEFWRKERLFLTVNHPGTRLLLHMADGVLGALSLGRVPEDVRRAFKNEFEEFEQPIHPQVGTFFQLPFAGEDHLYRVYEAMLTFRQYAGYYVACRLQNFDDFVIFLNLVTSNPQKFQVL